VKKAGIAMAIAILAWQIGCNFARRDESDNYAIRDLGYALLKGLPQVQQQFMAGLVT
jgi:hypothetical protein